MRKITAKRKRLLSALLAAALACLSACGNSAGTAGGSSQGEGGQAEPGYQGPLYQISFTKVTDRLPEFQDFTDSCVNLFSVNQYYGIELMTHFTQNDTIGIGTFQYCDGDFNYLPVGEDRDFLAYHDGYQMFLWMPTNTINREGWAIEVYDQDLNLVSTTADRFEGLSYGFAQLYLESGWLPLEEKATGLDGFFNVYTQEWRPLSASECLRTGGSYMNLVTCNSFYSDGLAYVTGADWAREYYAPTGLKHYEREVLGFLDESGQYAFRFEDLPEFDGLLVNMVTGFCDGTCIVAARYDDGAVSVPMPSEDAPYPFYQVDFVYEIDKTGKVLRQVDMDAFEAKEQEVIDRWGQMEVMEEEHTWNYYADSLRVADGLTLSVENPLPAGEIKSLSQVGGYTLTDANGNSYPLSGADPVRAIATDDGRIFLYCEKDPNTALAGSGDGAADSEASSAGPEVSSAVSETSSAASEALAADSAALTAEPDPLTDPADPNTDPAQQEGGLLKPDGSVSYSVTLTFDSQGGSQVAGQTLEVGSLAKAPANPARAGYTFTGWYRDAACTQLWDFAAMPVKANLTLYAGWQPVEQGGSGDSGSSSGSTGSSSENSGSTGAAATAVTAAGSAPATGDPFRLGLWLTLGLSGLALGAGATLAERKARRQ